MISDDEHLFIYLLALCISSLKRCPFKSFDHFLTGLFVFLILSSMSCLYILEINLSLLLSFVVSFANIFSHSEGCLFVLFMVSFVVQKPLSLIKSHLFIFVFICYSRRCIKKRSCCGLCQTVFFLCFSLKVVQCLVLHLSL